MGESLSKRLNFSVNKYPILLGKDLNAPVLNAHGLEKPNFWAKILLRPKKGELLFWSKNCELVYLGGDQNTITPVLDKNKSDKVIFGTTAYLWFKKNKLTKFGFQVMQNQVVVVTSLFEEIGKRLTASIGAPVSGSSNHKIWEIDNQRLVLEIPINTRYGYIHLMFR